MNLLHEIRPALIMLGSSFAAGLLVGAITLAAWRQPGIIALEKRRATAAAKARTKLAACQRELDAATQIPCPACPECMEPEAGPFVPIGGWCAEADRWCRQHGDRSLSCSDARLRCRLYVRDAGP